MQSELTRLHRQLGITFLFVTHAQSEALASRVAVMNEGRIIQIGALLDAYRAPLNRFVAEFVGMNNILTGPVGGLEGNETLVQRSSPTCAPHCRHLTVSRPAIEPRSSSAPTALPSPPTRCGARKTA